MNQTKTGTSSGCPNTQKGFVLSGLERAGKPTRFSVAFFAGMLMLALQLFTGKANAVNIPITAFSCTQTPTATSTCVGTGFYASGWQTPGGGYWQYDLSTVGYTTITMNFSTTKSAAAGPTSGQVYYNLGGADIAVPGGAFTVTTSCVAKSIALPVACEGVSNLIIRVKMLGATANTATNRITSVNVFNGTSTSCVGSPAAGGTVSTGTNPICGGTSATLTLTGATGGAGISYQWQSSLNGSSWTNIFGATGLSYNTPALNDTMYYRVLVTCSAAPLSPTASSTLRVDVNTVAIGAISGYSNPLIIGTPQVLSSTPSGGLWISSDPSVATIDGSGNLTGLFGGITDISYQVTDFTTGCVGNQTISVNTAWPNTLALYAGSTGTNTNVIPVPGDATSSLYATGFGTATPCGSGGLSGLTVNTSVIAFDTNAPHVGYKVYPDADSSLNMYRIHARARVSGTGPTKAVIAYRYWSGFNVSGWIVAANTVTLNSSSCGVMSNSWDFNTGNAVNPNPTVNGITDSLEVAVFPFASGANTGTFQLGSLEVYGIVTSDDACSGSPIVAADSALPALVTICDSGYRFLNYNIGSGGVAGVEITYQWQSSPDGSTWTDIPFAEGAVYQTDTLHAGMTSDTSYYRVQVLCSGTPVNESEPSMVVVSPTPSGAGIITGGVVSSILPFDHMLIGTNYNMSSTAGIGGIWSSNDTSVVSIVAGTGVATPHIPGDAVITYRKSVGGCFGASKDTVIALYNHTKALYVGRNGNSTEFYTSSDAIPVATPDLTTANFGTAVTCGNGGISGLTNTTTVPNDATNGQVVMSIAPAAGPITATEIHATLRKQPSGAYIAYLGYRTAGSGSWTVSTPVAVESDDCGYSHNELIFTFPSPLTVASGYDFAVFGFNGTATTTLQVNSISVIGTGGTSVQKGSPTGVDNIVSNGDNIQVYPNPVDNMLNIDATEAVNVAIFSIDGKKLLDQKNVKSVDVSNLMSGMYLIQVSNQNSMLLKTEKFIKK